MEPNRFKLPCYSVLSALLLLCALQARAFRAEDKTNQKSSPAKPQPSAAGARALSADQANVARMATAAGVTVEWHSRLGTPFLIRGSALGERKAYSGGKGLALPAGGAYEQAAIGVVDNLARFYRVQDATREFTTKPAERDSLGFHHVRLSQVYQGLRVFGGELSVHFGKDGQAYQVNGAYVPDIQVAIIPKLSGEAATRIALRDLEAKGKPAGTLVAGPTAVIFARNAEPQLAYELTLTCSDPKAGPGRWRYWIEAQQGAVLLAYNDIQTIAAPTSNGTHTLLSGYILSGEGGQYVSVTGWRENTGYYYLHNTNLWWQVYNVATSGYADNNTYAYRTSGSWDASDLSEMSAARNLDIVQRYYRDVHGRHSFNNAGLRARANVHEGTRYVNAFWDGTDFHFGDGDGTEATSLATLDICGHEFTHAVDQYSADLVYADESGALNESFSDVFGTCIEFYAQADGRDLYPGKSPGTADWLCGEDCWLSSTALRDFRNPRNSATVGVGNEQPSRYHGSYWYSGSGDNGGVHQNSGVQNFFFYLLCEGGSGNNDGTLYNVTGIGITNAEQVAYRALTVYCSPNTDYQLVRSAWMSAAMDLNPSWVPSVAAAWSAVGISALLVTPDSALTFRGPASGPFTPSSQTFTLANRGSAPMQWGLISTQSWLAVAPASGTIPAGASSTVTVSAASGANSLPIGIYTNFLIFSNSVDSAPQLRQAKLLVGQPDFFTELFSANDNDLVFQTWTFTPDGTSSFYAACRETAAVFPTDPAGGATLSLDDDDYRQITLSGTNTIALYGRRSGLFFIGSNGYLTLDSGDRENAGSLANHFNRPRVAGCFADLDPTRGGTISWKQTAELVAITFSNVREYGSTAMVSFQIELFFDGRIRLTCLGNNLTEELTGLSAGMGVPAAFAESDLTGYAACPPPDALVLLPYTGLAAQGYVGGPFTPAAATYTLTNISVASLNWSATVTQPWLSISPASGSLAGGAHSSLTISLRPQANALAPGLYSDTLSLSNLVTGFKHTRSVSLRVMEIPGKLAVLDSISPAADQQLPFGEVRHSLSRTEQITLTNSDASHNLWISNVWIQAGAYLEDFQDGQAQDWVPDLPTDWMVIGGEYRAQIASDEFMTTRYAGQEWSDLSVQMSCRRSGSTFNAAAVVLRATPDFDDGTGSGYVFQISTEGDYAVWKQVDGAWSWLQEWSTSSTITTDTNVLRAVAQGSVLRFYINGVLVWTGTDTSLASGRIGLMGYSSASEATTHYFDNIMVGDPLVMGAITDEQRWYNQHPVGGSPRAVAAKALARRYPGKPAETTGLTHMELSVTNGPWRLENLPALPFALAPRSALTFAVVYSPTAAVSNDAKVAIQSNDADQPRAEVQLSGQGIPDYLQVTPGAGLAFQGDSGGPFSPGSASYQLSNAGPVAISWTAGTNQAWVNVSPTAGTLAVGATASVTVALTPAANSLPTGQHAAFVGFTNLVTTAVQTRPVTLNVRMDYFTELFTSGDNDLAYQAWTFTPDGSAAGYSVCHGGAEAFPTDPAGGNLVFLDDDDYTQVTLSGANTVALYTRRTNTFFIGSNGYLTLRNGDTATGESLLNHFYLPRIAACFDDLDPSSGGTISWKETSELVAVTFSDVPDYGADAAVSFQIELFFDGRIRLTYLNVGVPDGLVGLSAGGGVPSAFFESDFSGYTGCRPPDQLAVTPYSGFTPAGYAGGPFTPASATYTLTNQGTAALTWSARLTQPWLQLSATSGTLPAGGSAPLTLTLNSLATSLAPGVYTDTLTVSNLVTGVRHTRLVQVTVNDPNLQVVALPYDLYDGGGYLWDIDMDGSVYDGSNDAYDWGLYLEDFPLFDTGTLANGELTIGPATRGGLQFTRRIYASPNHAYARFLEVIRNVSASTVTTTLTVYSDFGSDSSTINAGTSSGDTIFGVEDNWLVTDDRDGGGDPPLLHVIGNDSGALRPVAASQIEDEVTYQWQLTLAPGETKILMHFASQNPNRATALAQGPLLADLELDALAGISPADRQRIVNFSLLPPQHLDHFSWSPIASPQRMNTPMPVMLVARDASDLPMTNFTGCVTLTQASGRSTSTNTVGTGLGTVNFPMETFYHDERSQVIYLHDELGGAGRITALSLDVATLPGQQLNAWTIRMKHTALSTYSNPLWESSGWTVVYQTNLNVTAAGWVTFPFTTPFEYNGVDNLMIDFSFNNSTYTSGGYCRATSRNGMRSIYYRTDSNYGDPLAWSGSTPLPYTSSSTPNLRLVWESGSVAGIVPASVCLTNGQWSGNLVYQGLATNLVLRADDGRGHSGLSNPFNVLSPGLACQFNAVSGDLALVWNGSGFRLQAQTNSAGQGITTNWYNYPGGTASPVIIQRSPANHSVFYRLVYP